VGAFRRAGWWGEKAIQRPEGAPRSSTGHHGAIQKAVQGLVPEFCSNVALAAVYNGVSRSLLSKSEIRQVIASVFKKDPEKTFTDSLL
jgi:hypothetical protein